MSYVEPASLAPCCVRTFPYSGITSELAYTGVYSLGKQGWRSCIMIMFNPERVVEVEVEVVGMRFLFPDMTKTKAENAGRTGSARRSLKTSTCE